MTIIKPYKSTLPALAAIYLALSSFRASSQLLGCNDVACPFNKNGFKYCPIGNITAVSIGIANFSTAISAEPLTWTTVISSSPDPNDSWLEFHQRGYYLGAPPSLNLQDTTSIKGCALFFEAISPSLHFPLRYLDTDVGTCQDAMGSSCVFELMAQAQGKFSELVMAANDTYNICMDLESALRDSAPRACNSTGSGSWGTINTREITGSAASPPLRQGSCHPTTGSNYSIALVDTYHIVAEPSSTIINSFGYGVTPILTVFYNPNSTISKTEILEGQLKDPEFHLSCVRPVGQINGPHEAKGGFATFFRPDLGLAALVVFIASAVVLF